MYTTLRGDETIVTPQLPDDFEWPAEAEDAGNLLLFDDFDWLPELEEKIWTKHKLLPEMIEECFYEPDPKGKIREAGRGKYILYTHSPSGTYLFIVFVYKIVQNWRLIRIISARPMGKKEREIYRRK